MSRPILTNGRKPIPMGRINGMKISMELTDLAGPVPVSQAFLDQCREDEIAVMGEPVKEMIERKLAEEIEFKPITETA